MLAGHPALHEVQFPRGLALRSLPALEMIGSDSDLVAEAT